MREGYLWPNHEHLCKHARERLEWAQKLEYVFTRSGIHEVDER